jgi:NAD+ kinase
MTSEPRMHAVGLVLHPTESVDRSVNMIIAAADSESFRVLAREVDRQRVPPEVDVVSDAQFVAEVDGVIALGGDGTMLGAMRLMIDRPVPVLGVNHGGLGFLVEVTPAELPSALARLADGEFTVELHGCLEVRADAIELATRFGFNDVVLSRVGRGGAISLDLGIGDLQYGYYRGDAVVVSTATGSTAYNYAAGGPIVSPASDAFVITPVAPMSGINRSVVLGAEEQVAFTAATTSPPIAVDIDGTMAGELRPGDRLTATTRQAAAQVVRLSATEYASRSWVKRSLLDVPLRPDQMLDLIPSELRRNADAAGGGRTALDRSDR